MFWQLKLGHYRLGISWHKVMYVDGVCSLLSDGNHILMWDFDDVDLEPVLSALIMIQSWYALPRIYVLESSPNNYIAYCFRRYDFPNAVAIVAQTPGVDWNFVKLSVLRGYFTLRVSEKHGYEPRLIRVLESTMPESAIVPELVKFVRYETVARG